MRATAAQRYNARMDRIWAASWIAKAEARGAEFIRGLGQWKAGRGGIVTHWYSDKADAAKAFLILLEGGVP